MFTFISNCHTIFQSTCTFHPPISNIWEFLIPQHFQENLVLSFFFILAILENINWFLTVKYEVVLLYLSWWLDECVGKAAFLLLLLFYASRFFGWSKNQTNIRQIHRTKTNLISHYRNPEDMRLKDRWLMLICHSDLGEGGTDLHFQKGGSTFTGKWKEQMFGKQMFATPGR